MFSSLHSRDVPDLSATHQDFPTSDPLVPPWFPGDLVMGTPASVVSSPAWQAPEPRTRKKASANIFKDIDLLQLQTLFRAGGDECAEERAQIIYNYAGDRHIADALMKLRRKKRNKNVHSSSSKLSADGIAALSVQNFSKLCINESGHRGSTSSEEDSDRSNEVAPDEAPVSGTKKQPMAQRTKHELRRHQQQRRISGYLHQIKR
ncbi:arginine vasopressin-induced protein 1 isoform X2 [Rana temporaria]|nr:arginine vasopressin-induced protein 1 isoform X2 [Rana temporaria]